MTVSLVDRAPRVRCHECGAERVFAVCHHCQRPMCEEHSPPAFREQGAPAHRPAGSAEDARPASREFAGLHLGGQREAVYHCADHDHMVHGFPIRWVAAGAGLALLGFLLMGVSVQIGAVLVLIGAPVAGIAVAVHHGAVTGAVRPPLPFVQQVNTVEFVERLTGRVRLENGEYTSTVDSVGGEMLVDLPATDLRAQTAAYRRKFRLAPSEPVYHAGGFLMVEGDVGLAFRAGQASVLTSGTGIAFGGDAGSLAGHAATPGDSLRVVGYEVQDDRRPHEIPLWIVPSLVPASDRRTLEIDLHWNGLGPDDRPLNLTVFDLIELEVPAAWGNVEGVAPSRVEIGRTADGTRRTIRWKQLKPPGTGSITLGLHFERPISESDSPPYGDDGGAGRLTLAGTLEATFDGLLSGVRGVGVYLPGGGRGHDLRATTRTKVAVTFDASLRSIRYQDERVVPDENHPDDVARARIRVDEVPGVVPDHRTVAELTNAISVDNYYVKSVVEHLPHRDDGRTGVLNRVWDIAGRRYLGVFPIDFNINLRGEEVGTDGGLSGKTVAQVAVKGAYAMGTVVGEPDSEGYELLTQIEDTWTSLHDRVLSILANRAGPLAHKRELPPAAESLSGAEFVEAPGPGRSDDVVEAVVMEPTGNGRTFEATAVVVDVDGTASRTAGLRRQQKAADDAVVNGRISEETYREVSARIRAELAELEGWR